MPDAKTKEEKKREKAERRKAALAKSGKDPEAIKADAIKKQTPKAVPPKQNAVKQNSAKSTVAQVKKEESRTRKISERLEMKKRVITKNQTTQAGLTEPLFTYMRNSVPLAEIQKMGFGTRNPFSKSDNPETLHPAIVRLGFKAASNGALPEIGGATQRGQNLKTALTEFIEDFEGRDFGESPDSRQSLQTLFIQELNPNINFLSKCSPLVRSEACVIDCIKENVKSRDGNSAAENGLLAFKKHLIEQLDHFWSTRVTSAGLTISTEAQHLIKEKSTVMTFGGSQNVFRIFEQAQRCGKDFSVVIIDCEPNMNGKHLLAKLEEIDVPVRYATIAGLSYLMSETDIVIIAASSLLANGSVVCSKGSGIVACVAKEDQANEFYMLVSYHP